MIVRIRTDLIRSRHPDFLKDGGEKLLWHRLLNDSDLERYGRLAERLLDALRVGNVCLRQRFVEGSLR